MSETKKKVNLFTNVMTSGKSLNGRDESQMDTLIRYILLNFLIFFGGTFLFAFGVNNLLHGQTIMGLADILMGTAAVTAFVVLRTNAPFVVSGLLTVIPFLFLCSFFTQSGGAQGSGILWAYSFPMMAIFLLGMNLGLALSGVLLAIMALTMFLPGFSPVVFERQFAYRAVGVYVLVLSITVMYEITKITKDKWVARLTRSLKAERDEIATMKDNLKVGLFMMDSSYAIQPLYSKALEEILSETNMQHRNFLDLLNSSIQQRERETLMDYFTMVFNRSYDAQMLEDINPLHQFTYVHGATDERKVLRCTFAPIQRDDGKVYVLGTVQNVTREVELQTQLEAEEGKRQDEMRSLFEVIHVEPRVLNDFIEDTEYEFERINDILKDNDRSSHDVMVDIYQSVHAMKSNAVILGLKSFSTKLHALEDEIRVMRDDDREVSFEDVLHVTVELDKLMRIKDGFSELIAKITSFGTGEAKMQGEYVLVQTLERTIERAGADLGKKANLVVKGIDARAVSSGPRRAMKEILMQLVRNAVYHGIEEPAFRLAKGKPELGSVSVSIELSDDKIVMQVSDDGRGLDFDAIREKARAMNLLSDPSDFEDKNALTQVLFAPGFSTAKKADMYAGRGIGLNLVKDRVKEMRGTIKLQSEDGKGTVFKVTIPAEAAMSTPVTA